MQRITDLKLEILICFSSLIIEHWTPLHQTSHIFPIPLSDWEMFVTFEALGVELQIFLELQKQRNDVWGFDLVWVLIVFVYLPMYSQRAAITGSVFFVLAGTSWKKYTKVGTFWGEKKVRSRFFSKRNSNYKRPFDNQNCSIFNCLGTYPNPKHPRWILT